MLLVYPTENVRPRGSGAPEPVDYISYLSARKKSPLCTHLDEIVSTSYGARFCEDSSHPRGALWWCESHLLFADPEPERAPLPWVGQGGDGFARTGRNLIEVAFEV